jgi:hypothetical protein
MRSRRRRDHNEEIEDRQLPGFVLDTDHRGDRIGERNLQGGNRSDPGAGRQLPYGRASKRLPEGFDVYSSSQLKEFAHGLRDGAKLLYESGAVEELKVFFPGMDGPDYFENYTPNAIFTTFMNSILAINPDLEGLLKTADARIVGALAESSDRGCVVTKMKVTMEGRDLEVYEVLPIRRSEGKWLIAMKGQLKQLFQIMFAK